MNEEGTFFSNTDDLGHLLTAEQGQEVGQFADWLFELLDEGDEGCVRVGEFLDRLGVEPLLGDVFEM